MTSKVTNIDAVLKAIGKLRGNVEVAIAPALLKCGNVILKKSQVYVPVDTGALKASGKVEAAGVGKGAKVTVGYGGPDAPYALFVHEDPGAHHAPPTSFKYLSRSVTETRGACANLLKREMQAAIEKSVK